MASLQHQGVVQVFEPELQDNGYYFFTMEYVRGGTLYEAIIEERLGLVCRPA